MKTGTRFQVSGFREKPGTNLCDFLLCKRWRSTTAGAPGLASETWETTKAHRPRRRLRAALIAGCRQDMHDQPKIIPQRGSNLFDDHRGARPQVVNTVARGQLREDSYFYTGVTQGANGYREEHDELPFPATLEVLKRGQERFNIYCSPCHSRVGNGLGEIVQRGYKPAANLHDQVRLAQPLSHYFYVMTQRVRRHARLLRAADAGGPVGGGRLHPRPAAEPGRQGERRAFRRPAQEPEGRGRQRRPRAFVRRALADARHRRAALPARLEAGLAGHGSGQPRRPQRNWPPTQPNRQQGNKEHGSHISCAHPSRRPLRPRRWWTGGARARLSSAWSSP